MTRSPSVRIALDEGPTSSVLCLASRYLSEYREKIQGAVEPLDGEALWWRPGETSNSIANLLLHLSGNLSLWILAGVGGQSYVRHRAAEFASRDRELGPVLRRRLDTVVEGCRDVLAGLDDASLVEPREIQGYATNVLGAVFHATEHMSYHTGQILWIAKTLRGAGNPIELYPRHAKE